MRYLLDTNILVFLSENESKIEKKVKNIIEDCSNRLYVSDISVIEFIHLMQKGRINS